MQRMESIESKVESILTTIKRESVKNLIEDNNENNFDIDIDLNLLNNNKLNNSIPLMVPLLKKPPINSVEPVQAKIKPLEQVKPKIKSVELVQQPIPIISITNFNNHLCDPRIEHQNKNLQNKLKKLFMVVSANNHQQIKLNNSFLFNENSLKLEYELDDLKVQVEANLRTNLPKFQGQTLLPDYYEITRQLECIFTDLADLQERVCSDHSFFSDLYDYLNEIKLVFGVKLKTFFKMNQLPSLFEKILTPIPLSNKMRLTYMSTMQVENEIRDPRLRKQRETQIKAIILKVPTPEMLTKKYLLDLKCLKYNLSNETPTSPALHKMHKVQIREQKSQPVDQLVQKNKKIVGETLPLLMNSPNEFTQELCDNIRKNVINETNTVKQEQLVHQVLNLLAKFVNKNIEEEEKISKNDRKRSRTRYNRSRSRSHAKRSRSSSRPKRSRSRSQYRDKNNKKKSRSRSRSRSRQRRRHSRSRRDRIKSKRDRSATSSSASTKSSTPVTEAPAAATSTTVTTKTKTKIFFNNQETNEATKHDSQIINKHKYSLLV